MIWLLIAVITLDQAHFPNCLELGSLGSFSLHFRGLAHGDSREPISLLSGPRWQVLGAHPTPRAAGPGERGAVPPPDGFQAIWLK